MPDVLSRYGLWLEAAHSLLEEHHREFPRARVAEVLDETFEVPAWSWNWAEPDGSLGVWLERPPPSSSWPRAGPSLEWVVESHQHHPLLAWFAHSGDPHAMSTGRVPTSVVSVRAQREYRMEYATLTGIDHQLSIPYVWEPGRYRAFVLGRCGDDFTHDDVALARWIQPLLTLLNLHVISLAASSFEPAHDAGLTARETTVLSLLADGATACGMARKLQVSPRTVHNHLQRVYRKLEVHDRMGAVIRAQSLGIVEPWPGRSPVVDSQADAGRPGNVPPTGAGARSEPRRSFAYALDPETGRLVEVS
jgi:DNA-binding CsgD family transcriptional regulator